MSNMYAIKETTLTALGDAIRAKKNEQKTLSWSGEFADFITEAVIYVSIQAGRKYRLLFTVNELENSNFDSFDVYICGVRESGTVRIAAGQTYQLDFVAKNTGDNIKLKNTKTYTGSYIFAELDENDNVISNTYTPIEMVEAIEGLETKVPVEPIVLSGDCQYTCAGPIAAAYIKANSDTITTKDISNGYNMFNYSPLEEIPFDINLKSGNTSIRNLFYYCQSLETAPDIDCKHTNYAEMSSVFYNCRALKNVPKITNAYPSSIDGLFAYCYQLREIPEDWFDTWNFNRMKTYAYANGGGVFNSCFSLRKAYFPYLFKQCNEITAVTNPNNLLYYNGFNRCFVLDELVDLPVYEKLNVTSSLFYGTVSSCHRLKNFLFETNEDGTPKVVNWKTQSLDLTSAGHYVISSSQSFADSTLEGMATAISASEITKHNSGITNDKVIYNTATYQALKNDPDAFCINSSKDGPLYSRYNHDSAVATINSLPDTSAYLASAGGTNTIRFKGEAGSATDGGAINTLTEAEIAVATAKGWTVTFA